MKDKRVKIENLYSEGKKKWHLRMAITSRCNFRCKYCLPKSMNDFTEEPEFKDIVETLEAAFINGITRVHWTGGEPTLRKDFVDIVSAAKDIGYNQQILTTNGFNLWKNLSTLKKNGLTRVNISLDTLNAKKNKVITNMSSYYDTIKSIEACVNELDNMTKINVVTMKSTLDEMQSFIQYADELNRENAGSGSVAIKFNQFFPSNPAQLEEEGQSYWKNEFVNEQEILSKLKEIGEIKKIERKLIEGDNPSYDYYQLNNYNVKVAVLALFSWKYKCGECWKLRITPQGFCSICVNQDNLLSLWGKDIKEKAIIINQLISFRDSEKFYKELPERKHYRKKLGDLRFGNQNKKTIAISDFERILNE